VGKAAQLVVGALAEALLHDRFAECFTGGRTDFFTENTAEPSPAPQVAVQDP